VGGSKTRDRIPTNSAVESLAARRATSLSANVVSYSNVVKGRGVSCCHFVEKGSNVAERLSSLGIDVVIQKGNDTTNDGGRARGSTNRLNSSIRQDEHLRTESSKIRETTTILVEVIGRRKRDSRSEVFSNSSLLVSGRSSNNGETTTRREVSLIEANSLFNTTRGSAPSRAARRGVGEVSNTRGGGDLGSPNRGDIGRATRVDRVKVVLGTIRIGTAVSTRVTRCSDDGKTTETNLLELDVDSLNVLSVGQT